jgi:hypothetical protein
MISTDRCAMFSFSDDSLPYLDIDIYAYCNLNFLTETGHIPHARPFDNHREPLRFSLSTVLVSHGHSSATRC